MTTSFTTQIEITVSKTRKRPVTDDMVQMCADLKIEPYTDMRDVLARAVKRIDKMLIDAAMFGRRAR